MAQPVTQVPAMHCTSSEIDPIEIVLSVSGVCEVDIRLQLIGHPTLHDPETLEHEIYEIL